MPRALVADPDSRGRAVRAQPSICDRLGAGLVRAWNAPLNSESRTRAAPPAQHPMSPRGGAVPVPWIGCGAVIEDRIERVSSVQPQFPPMRAAGEAVVPPGSFFSGYRPPRP